MSDFYITVPSNVKSSAFPDNKTGDFVCALPNHIDFKSYRIALVELQYPNSWPTVPRSVVGIKHPGSSVPSTFEMPEGKYNSVTDFVDEILKGVRKQNAQDHISIHYDSVTMKVNIVVKTVGWELVVTETYANILGFVETIFPKGQYRGKRNADLDEGMTALYVYTDIVRPQLVGDTLAPLLRVVAIKGNRDVPYVTEEFRHPRYLEGYGDTTNLIRINISRDDGRTVSFKSGKVIATLHFKRKV